MTHFVAQGMLCYCTSAVTKLRISQFFTRDRRDAMYSARTMLSVCLSFALRSCVKTGEHNKRILSPVYSNQVCFRQRSKTVDGVTHKVYVKYV